MLNPLRSAIALAGTAVPILLLILQLALLQGVRTEVVRVYSDFNFDIAILPATYEYLMSNGSFDRIRLAQARSVPGVSGTFNLNVTPTSWSAYGSRYQSPVILIGMDNAPEFISDQDLRTGLERLSQSDAVLVDRYSSPLLGPLGEGTDATVNLRPVKIAGSFALGMFFYAEGAVAVGNSAFPALSNGDARQTSFGLVQVRAGTPVEQVRQALAQALPHDVRIVTREQLIDGEQAFFVSVKPLGVMVTIGMVIAALAGTVVLWQVLSSGIARRIHEFATLSAIGFAPQFVLGVGLCETILLGLAAFIPALVVGTGILDVVAARTHLPEGVTLSLALDVLAVVAAMSGFCAASVLYRISRADPSSLF